MKLLWHSNAPWVPTGYGQQTRIFAPKIRDTGVDVAISAMFGLGGDSTHWDGIKVYPQGYDAYSNDVIAAHAADHLAGEPGWILILFDVWTMKNAALRDFNVAAWTPVDHDPPPPGVLKFFQEMRALPIAMSQFGQRKLGEFGFDALYVPHGFDPVFEPKDQLESRQAIGIPESAFVVGMNAANKANKEFHRKNFDGAFQAFKQFTKTHSDALLYIHAESAGGIGHDLENMVAFHGLDDHVQFADQYAYRQGVPIGAMPYLYSSFDVFLNPAYGEGFGVPIIESQACGVPAIVTDFTAMTELAGPGWAVDGQKIWHEPHQSMWMIPSVAGIVEALDDAYYRSKDLKDECVEFVAPYAADRVMEEYWLPVLDNLSERVDPVAVAA